MVASLAMTVDPNAAEDLRLYDLFGDNESDTGNADSPASVDGVKLVDTRNSKLYLVASDGAGSCVCTNSFSGNSAKPGDVVNMSATYAAAPGRGDHGGCDGPPVRDDQRVFRSSSRTVGVVLAGLVAAGTPASPPPRPALPRSCRWTPRRSPSSHRSSTWSCPRPTCGAPHGSRTSAGGSR